MYLLSCKFLESKDNFYLVYDFQRPPQCLEVEVTEKKFVEQMDENTFWSYPTLQHEAYAPPGMVMPGCLEAHSEPLSCHLSKLNFLLPSLPSKCFSQEFSTLPPPSLWYLLHRHITGLSTSTCMVWITHFCIILWWLILSALSRALSWDHVHSIQQAVYCGASDHTDTIHCSGWVPHPLQHLTLESRA